MQDVLLMFSVMCLSPCVDIARAEAVARDSRWEEEGVAGGRCAGAGRTGLELP